MLEPVRQLDGLDDEIHSGLELAGGKGDESPPRPPAAPRPGLVLDCHAEVALTIAAKWARLLSSVSIISGEAPFVGRRWPRLRGDRRAGW